jgi:hypothetical protein
MSALVLTAKYLAICAAIFGMGVATPVVYKKAKAGITKPAKPVKVVQERGGRTPPSRPRVGRVENRIPAPASIIDCPTQRLDLKPYDVVVPPANNVMWVDGGTVVIVDDPVVGGGGTTPGIPEGDVWAYLITGFGLVGASMRRSRSTTRA